MRLELFALPVFVAIAQAADYSGPLRPQVHFSPPQGFMNDPNGMFYDTKRSIYHLYYQCKWSSPSLSSVPSDANTDNPSEPVAGNQHWGHATSSDLYHWTNHPPALEPDSSDHLIFSGSAVVDTENTSEFFPEQDDGVVAIYTVHSPTKETQHIAYSTDGGYTFTKYADNPVIDSHTDDFRDPKVIWHPETQKWVMFVAWAHAREIGIFTSPNLKYWTPTSNYSQPGLPGVEFECPNLVKFPVENAASNDATKDVLFISVNPGAPLGGSGTFYVVGDFNGTHFNSEVDESTLYDFARDNYASQWFYGLPESSRAVSIGWASNWDYTEEVPTAHEGWRSATALPREHTLTKVDGAWTVTQMPFQALSSVRHDKLEDKTFSEGDVSIDFSDVVSNSIYFEVAINGIPSSQSAGEISFNFTSSSSEEYLDGGFFFDTGLFWISRAGTHLFTRADNADFAPDFNTTISASESGQFTFSGVIDRSVFEVFLDEGRHSGTMDFYSTSALDALTVSAAELDEKTTVDVRVWGLASGWDS